jgi:hypothetical protein
MWNSVLLIADSQELIAGIRRLRSWPSVFEEIIEGCASVTGALTGPAGGFLFYHYPYGIERAVVPLVFGRDSGGNGLVAFEATGRVEVFALFARVQGESALVAFADVGRQVREKRSAFGAARHGPCTGHVHRPRSKGVLFLRSRRSGLLKRWFLSATGILIAALPILGIGQ